MIPVDHRDDMRRLNDTGGPFDETPAHEQILRAGASRPDRAAITCGGNVVSYAELIRAAGALARTLAKVHRATIGSRVAILLPRSPSYVTAMLAALQAGACYVPLDTAWPVARIEAILQDLDPTAVVTDETWRARLGNGSILCTALSTVVRDDGRPLPRVAPSDLMYIIYTSGSTGRPKGVMVEHRSVSNFLDWSTRLNGVGEGDTILGLTPFTFDVSVAEIFGALTNGATLALEPRPYGLDTATLPEQIRSLHAVPSAFKALSSLSALLSRERTRLRIANLNLAGEALDVDLAHRIMARVQPDRLRNCYGPTEATIYATSADLCLEDRGTPIGRPVQNMQAHVLDDSGVEVADGAVGELYLSGVGLARGYWNQLELTRQHFCDHIIPGKRLYRTGDLVRIEQGQLFYVGRKDQQVKINGFRIEVEEIERLIRAYPGIGDCAVVAADRGLGKRLYLYYTTDRRTEPQELRSHLAARLPPFMVPTRLWMLPRLPTLTSGKIDRAALVTLSAPTRQF